MINASFVLGATVLVGAALPSFASDDWSGASHFECIKITDDNRCELEWSLDIAAPNPLARVEEMDIAQNRWETVFESDVAHATDDDPLVRGGRLYRAVACDSNGDACLSTDVYWAPFRTSIAAEIPAEVTDNRGETFGVSKNLDLEEQLQQYNVYLVTSLVRQIEDRSILPQMTSPISDPFLYQDGHSGRAALAALNPSDNELIHFVVYRRYETERLAPLLSNSPALSR